MGFIFSWWPIETGFQDLESYNVGIGRVQRNPNGIEWKPSRTRGPLEVFVVEFRVVSFGAFRSGRPAAVRAGAASAHSPAAKPQALQHQPTALGLFTNKASMGSLFAK